MAVRRLDVDAASQDVLDRIYGVMARCHAEKNAEEPYRSRAEMEAYVRNAPVSELRDYWTAERGGDCVGFAQLGARPGSTTARVEILVHPDARREGHGAELLEAVLGAGEI